MVVVGAALVAGGALPFAFLETVSLCAVLAVLALAARRARMPMVLAAVVALAVNGARSAMAVRQHERGLADAHQVIPRTARCAGVVRVTSSPEEKQGALRWKGELQAAECDGAPWSGPVTLYGGPSSTARGDTFSVVAQLAQPTRLWNETDPRPAEARQGSLRSGEAIDARLLHPGTGAAATIDHARAFVRARIEATFPLDVAPMARALVLGESDLSPDDDVAMRTSGLAHLLAVSGMHLILAVAGAVAALRILLLRVPFLAARHDVGRFAAAFGVPLAWGYAEFAGSGGSTRRAAWMLTTSFVVRVLGRRPNAARAFGWSLLAMAACDPLAAFDVSFVLSGAATAGLLLFSRPLVAAASPWTVARGPLVRSAGATLAATIPCAPILARFAPTLPMGGVLANLLAVPVGESLALPLCLLHALLSPWSVAERGCALAASGALRMVRLIARSFAAMHFLSAAVPLPTSWQAAAIAVALVGPFVGPRAWRAAIVAAAASAVLLAEVGAVRGGAPAGVLRVTYLDVGQGDAALVDFPDRTAALIDGGGLVGSPVDIGERVIAPTLRARRRDNLRFAVLTHPHPDHFGGLVSGLRSIRVGELWDTGQGEREGAQGGYATLLESLRARGIEVLRPEAFCGTREVGGVVVDVLAPCPGPLVERDPNNNSVVFRLSFGRRAFLFVGDTEREEEADLLQLDAKRLRADVLKVGHHGSRTSSTRPFLAAVGPSVAVVSAGVRNRFGHPHPTTLAALQAAGAQVFRTDLDGAVTVTTDGQALAVRSARSDVDGSWPSF
jgi:competence protein ComEC